MARWLKPRSVCKCGHTGDGLNSEHADRVAEGHGECKVSNCGCFQFTWDGFTPEYMSHMNQHMDDRP
jgi:hypothetical protein